MAFTPFVQTQQSLFDSPLIFASAADARVSAQNMADRLACLYLRIVHVGINETDASPNHVLRDGVLIRIRS